MEAVRSDGCMEGHVLSTARSVIDELRYGSEPLTEWHPGFSVMRVVGAGGGLDWVDAGNMHKLDNPVPGLSEWSIRDELQFVASRGRLDQFFSRTWYTDDAELRYVVDLLGLGTAGSCEFLLGSRTVIGGDAQQRPHSFHLLVTTNEEGQLSVGCGWGDVSIARADSDAVEVLDRLAHFALDAYLGLATGEYTTV